MTDEEIEKVNFLNRYVEAKIECDRIGYVLESYRELERSARRMSMSMVSQKSRRDISDYIAKVETQEQELFRAYRAMEKGLTEVSTKIAELKSREEKMILTERFINGKTMNDIAWEYHYSRRNLYRLYNRAIRNLRI
jgi:DNA-directed RNA polymerase specialized sigma subunit